MYTLYFWFISDPQEIACSDCEKGKSNINIVSSSADDCVSCSVGTYENGKGSSRPECLLCPSEKSLNTVGATAHFECLACPGENSSLLKVVLRVYATRAT